MDITQYCKLAPINWESLAELDSRLARFGLALESESVELGRYPVEVKYDSFGPAREYVLENGEPKYYAVIFRASGHGGTSPKVTVQLARFTSPHDGPLLLLAVSGYKDRSLLDSVSTFLGLEADDSVENNLKRERTVFIAHRFDDNASAIVGKLARFFELLNFKVVTGRSYAPGSVSGKVRGRLESQALVCAVSTPGEDPTWLAQETLLAEIKGKPLFLLKEEGASFKPALLADHEYITFRGQFIESTFIPLLEGLREAGYFKAES